MGIFDKLEGRLERAYNGVFARAFRAEVQPVEIASAIRRAMDDRAASVGRDRAQVPNVFTIELSETDYERLTSKVDELDDELIAAAEEHADSQHYRPAGPVTIHLVEDVDLETGVFRLRPASARRPRATGYTGQYPSVQSLGGWTDDEPGRDAPDREEPPGWRVSGDDGAGDDVEAAKAPAVGAEAAFVAGAGEPPWPEESDREPPSRGGRRGPEPDVHPPEESAAAPPEAGKPARMKATDRPWFDIDGDRYLLMGARNIVGRDESCDVGLDDPGVSRRHAEVRVTIDGPHFVTAIRDLGSTNGTFVNGERITTLHLRDGDRVTVGRTTMTYRVRR